MSNFLAHLSALFKRNRRYVDYTSGLIGIWTLKPKAQQQPEGFFNSKYLRPGAAAAATERDYFHSALLPCKPFLSAFKDPLIFASMLQTKAENVVAEWPVLNRGLAPLDRIMAERSFTLYKNTYRSDRNNVDIAEYEMQISSFGYTALAQRVPVPEPLQLRDLKASI